MNRIVVLGLALFFALVGIALIGGDSKAVAFGHRCGGCNGCASSCHGGHRCHGGGGCHSRCHGRHRCHGGCNGGCNGGGCCGGSVVQAPEKQAPAPMQAPAK
jgi:hypothetical protein